MDRHSFFGNPDGINYPPWTVSQWFLLIAVLLVLTGVLLFAFRSALRGLFGFGVVLEAVPYPGLPMRRTDPRGRDPEIDWPAVPSRFIAVAAPDAVRRQLETVAGDNLVDLFSATETGAKPVAIPDFAPEAPRLILFANLEMLMRNRERRLRALAIFERIVVEQRRAGDGEFVIGLISDLSPLDRLLQSYERDAEELERLEPKERHSRRTELAGEREDVRWSRLFESFTTYIHRAARRARIDPRTLPPDEREVVRVVEREVAYLPDHVVAAVIPDTKPPLAPEEIANWAKSLKGSAPRAIVDYLSSQLIEHYQLAWSVSSHAERLLLYRYAHGQLVNVGEAYALRSLVRRGLVVFDPAPRIMSRSFAQFVRHVEEPRTLERWRERSERSGWQNLRSPLMIALPFAFGVVAVIAIRSGESLAALLPFVVSVGPALVNFFNNSRRVPS